MAKRVKREHQFDLKKEEIFPNSNDENLKRVCFYPGTQNQFQWLGGFLDYFDCISQLENWLKKVQTFKLNTKGHPLLVINGLVKVGKSAVLELIPFILPKHFPKFEVCSISFLAYSIETAYDFFQQFYAELYNWAFKTFQIPVRAPVIDSVQGYQVAIEDLIDEISKKYDGYVFYLFDEIQRWFLLTKEEIRRSEAFAFFKILVGDYDKQYFIVTGSGMATAWNGFLKAPPHGHRLANTITSIDIPEICDSQIMEWCVRKLNMTDFIHYVKNPAQLVFLKIKLFSIKITSSIDDFIRKEVDVKYIEEFILDMIPLLQEVDETNRKYMRALALGIATEPPKGIFRHYLNNFVNQNIPINDLNSLNNWNIETNNSPLPQDINHFIGLRSSQFSSLVTMFINPDGILNKDVLNEWKSNFVLPISISQFKNTDFVAIVGSLCENINGEWERNPVNDPNHQLIEDTCQKIFNKYQYVLNVNTYVNIPWFQCVYKNAYQQFTKDKRYNNWDVIDKNIIQPKNGTFNYWYCTLFKLSRNYLFHQVSDLSARIALVKTFPPWIFELIEELMKNVSALNPLKNYFI